MTPEMEEGIRIAQSENPNMADVQPYGFLSRMMLPSAQGYTSPGRTIYLNPKTMIGQQPQEVADTLTHEQKHVEQMNQRGYNPVREFLHETFSREGPYSRRPDEMESFQAEKSRRTRMNRMPTATPNFDTGEFHMPQDIRLSEEKSRINTGPQARR
jgi:hypothetical protein